MTSFRTPTPCSGRPCRRGWAVMAVPAGRPACSSWATPSKAFTVFAVQSRRCSGRRRILCVKVCRVICSAATTQGAMRKRSSTLSTMPCGKRRTSTATKAFANTAVTRPTSARSGVCRPSLVPQTMRHRQRSTTVRCPGATVFCSREKCLKKPCARSRHVRPPPGLRCNWHPVRAQVAHLHSSQLR